MLFSRLFRRSIMAAVGPVAAFALLGVAEAYAMAQDLTPKPVKPEVSFLSPLRPGENRGAASRPLLVDPKAHPTTRSTARRLGRPRLSDSFLPNLTQQWDGEPLPTLTTTPELRLEQRGLQSLSSSTRAAAARRKQQSRRVKAVQIHRGG